MLVVPAAAEVPPRLVVLELEPDLPPVAASPPVGALPPVVTPAEPPLAALEPPLELLLAGLPLQPQSRNSNNSSAAQVVSCFVIFRPKTNMKLHSSSALVKRSLENRR